MHVFNDASFLVRGTGEDDAGRGLDPDDVADRAEEDSFLSWLPRKGNVSYFIQLSEGFDSQGF